ncbi:hypothetical protein GLOTRDRAFT_139136 [Gloeophyllum trabeum ATCC 11539]|uniref:Histone H1 n=1 Tax=Gloeophyllum trabeum (strain ATCC 11539 / FP-39264 / Madison 617) TaxID=670483 RepID=S7RJQ6_GLOTA|nr:uncharacterized protein GLOTRDRAFT_139136 [Gloeophyllum trabeum ATCC 11539]EPQ54585.1 hypothetical protein GLOTRDRAFT_139136 [Gloeophyllum trabeum ATCC 11539]
MEAPSGDAASPAPTTQPQDAASQPPQSAANDRPNFVHSDETNLKRSYLRLLPPVQVVEICLSFDPYVPPDVKNRIWPVDFHSAIAALQLEASVLPRLPGPSREPPFGHTPVAKASAPFLTNSPTATAHGNDPPPMDSLQDPASSSNTPAAQTEQTASTTSLGSTATTQPTPQLQPVGGPSHSNSPAPTTQPNKPPSAYAQTQPPYPHVPYGYHPHHLYPHASYYGHPPSGYPPHYPPYPGAYPHYPQAGAYPATPHTPPVPHHEPPPPTRPPILGGHPGGSAEDLPSYEDMIVEALMDCADPEGLAPKNMFLWMAARYPLQSNFRPSASQALQKAFKRGRLEKSSDGKYRLNAAWEGGSTSKRTTRRPQTQTQVALSHDLQSSKSPFTNAPLAHRAGSAPANVPPNYNSPLHAGATPYPYQTSGYPGYQYSGWPASLPAGHAQAQKTTVSSTSASANNASKPDANTQSAEAPHVDAWEAAQSILKAINFGPLLEQANLGATSVDVQPPEPSATASQINGDGSGPAPTLTDEEKAALQAQLALLAAQLEEIAEEEEMLATAEHHDPAEVVSGPSRQSQTERTRERDEDVESEDSDEDMEMVDVSVPIDPPRT